MTTSTRLCVAALLGGLSMVAAVGCNSSSVQPRINPERACIDARVILREASQSTNHWTRAQAIEALAGTLGEAADGFYLEALSDIAPNVRYAAALAIGELKYAPAKSKLLSMAKFKVAGAERDPRVYAGVLFALYRLDNIEHLGDLILMLDNEDADIRKNAVFVLGLMGERSAVRALKSLCARERDLSVKVQVLEALAMLGDRYSASMIEASIEKPTAAERLIAVRTLARLGGQRSVLILRAVLHSPRQMIRVRASAAGSLGQLGEVDDSGYDLCLTSAREPQEVMQAVLKMQAGGRFQPKPLKADIASLQELAAVSLGHMGRAEAVDVLHPLLRNASDNVRVAAAMSILRLLPEYASGPSRPVEASRESPIESQPGRQMDPRKRPKLKSSPWK